MKSTLIDCSNICEFYAIVFVFVYNDTSVNSRLVAIVIRRGFTSYIQTSGLCIILQDFRIHTCVKHLELNELELLSSCVALVQIQICPLTFKIDTILRSIKERGFPSVFGFEVRRDFAISYNTTTTTHFHPEVWRDPRHLARWALGQVPQKI